MCLNLSAPWPWALTRTWSPSALSLVQMVWELVGGSVCFREAQASDALDNFTATDDFFSPSNTRLLATLVTRVALPLSSSGCENYGRRIESDVK